MVTRVLVALLNGIITFIILGIIVIILGMVSLAAIASVIIPFIIWIAVIVAILTFLGAIPNMWSSVIR